MKTTPERCAAFAAQLSGFTPPGSADTPGVQLRGRVDAGEIQLDDDDSADAAAGQRPRDRSPDHASAHDQDICAFHRGQILARRARMPVHEFAKAIGDHAPFSRF